GKFTRWEIQRGRTQDEINSIMLAMMMNTALKFEAYQSLKAFSRLDFNAVEQQGGLHFAEYFAEDLQLLSPLAKDGLVDISEKGI
ncbi:hypothetical protein MJI12_26840, partial [Salmonella enterica subsp. enterica serovar Kentucky]|nr:hypothetical protein [Salmonella enterica subsp. enterica serovar Kentucky]